MNELVAIAPPTSEDELLDRARSIAGHSLKHLAQLHNQSIPAGLTRAKGWTGNLMERVLGATASTRPEPDFEMLQIELKTVPVNRHGDPIESTYVCAVHLLNHRGIDWERSTVYKKLKRVLWIPIEGETHIPLAQRRIGSPLLWSPDSATQVALQQDWEELMEMIALGQVDKLTAHYGQFLQIRPKAANAREQCEAVGEHGEHIKALPRGFYLRREFTTGILRQHFIQASF